MFSLLSPLKIPKAEPSSPTNLKQDKHKETHTPGPTVTKLLDIKPNQRHLGTSRVVQWLGHCSSNVGKEGLISGQGTRILYVQPKNREIKQKQTKDNDILKLAREQTRISFQEARVKTADFSATQQKPERHI